ncbi:MAG: hypothetical protein IT210_07290 [Armatimonadetes bacterium]|nr:hypothetical protein [Armatimonadota bacterium]
MSPPSLRMRRSLTGDLPALALPAGFGRRAMRSGEGSAWAGLLNGAGDLGEWAEERVPGRRGRRSRRSISSLWSRMIRLWRLPV